MLECAPSGECFLSGYACEKLFFEYSYPKELRFSITCPSLLPVGYYSSGLLQANPQDELVDTPGERWQGAHNARLLSYTAHSVAPYDGAGTDAAALAG